MVVKNRKMSFKGGMKDKNVTDEKKKVLQRRHEGQE
jgi:hypothetical protein